jgi:hypothetical protein
MVKLCSSGGDAILVRAHVSSRGNSHAGQANPASPFLLIKQRGPLGGIPVCAFGQLSGPHALRLGQERCQLSSSTTLARLLPACGSLGATFGASAGRESSTSASRSLGEEEIADGDGASRWRVVRARVRRRGCLRQRILARPESVGGAQSEHWSWSAYLKYETLIDAKTSPSGPSTIARTALGYSQEIQLFLRAMIAIGTSITKAAITIKLIIRLVFSCSASKARRVFSLSACFFASLAALRALANTCGLLTRTYASIYVPRSGNFTREALLPSWSGVELLLRKGLDGIGCGFTA